jgi:hypothetical protein
MLPFKWVNLRRYIEEQSKSAAAAAVQGSSLVGLYTFDSS